MFLKQVITASKRAMVNDFFFLPGPVIERSTIKFADVGGNEASLKVC